MKNLKTITLTAATYILLACSCELEEPPYTLPPITQEGANTFGCKINGEVWISNGYSGINTNGRNPAVRYESGKLDFGAIAVEETGDEQLSCNIYMINSEGIYTPENATAYIDFISDASSYCRYDNDFTNEYWGLVLDTSYFDVIIPTPNWQIEITRIDTINRFVSGLFEFYLINKQSFLKSDEDILCDTLLHITEGRFDIKY